MGWKKFLGSIFNLNTSFNALFAWDISSIFQENLVQRIQKPINKWQIKKQDLSKESWKFQFEMSELVVGSGGQDTYLDLW